LSYNDLTSEVLDRKWLKSTIIHCSEAQYLVCTKVVRASMKFAETSIKCKLNSILTIKLTAKYNDQVNYIKMCTEWHANVQVSKTIFSHDYT